MQEEVTQKTITFCIQTTKMTTDVLQKAVSAYLRSQSSIKADKQHQGKTSVKKLAKQNGGMTNIEITKKNIKSFERHARKYGINYALKKDKSKIPPVYMVFFKGRDQDAINAAFRDFTQKQLQKANRPSIHYRLRKFREFVTDNFKNKTKHRHHEESL
jgi:seryl-tRNA(Sec) selenium transferase